MRKISVLVFILIVFLQVSLGFCFAKEPNPVRVAIAQDISALRIKIEGFYEVINPKTNKVLYRGRHLNSTATVYKGGILLANVRPKSDRLFIRTYDPDEIIINGRRFRGDIELIKAPDAHLLAINHIGLESYVKGILFHEVSHYWPVEVLKTQAIVCRSYALYQCQENKNKDFDVTNDTYSQVYGGLTSERLRTSKAVDETKGMVLFFNGKILPAFFHATCGGFTENVSALWNLQNSALSGVKCDFCKESPHFNWHCCLSAKEIEEKLLKAGIKIQGIKDILVVSRNNSGRVVNLKVTGSEKEMDILAKDFRNIIGSNIIKSTNFNVTSVKGDFIFEGLGWGHGVGLCQWGAYFMAKQGSKFEEILKFYYPGAEIISIGQ
ncbi:MAG: SpoIID/LytB domain-containing protein [Candidatus Omnitrophica bacterium]|nr:SpoIID/LytB domain-containing protein [Candidatus Omnitrophota bacterium]